MLELFECIYEGCQIGVKVGVGIVVACSVLGIAYFLFIAPWMPPEALERQCRKLRRKTEGTEGLDE